MKRHPSADWQVHGVTVNADDGTQVDPREVISPLCIAEAGHSGLRAIGTCFSFFPRQNVSMTAAHVFAGEGIVINNDFAGAFDMPPGKSLVSLTFHRHQSSAAINWLMRPVQRIWTHPSADLAFCRLGRVQFIKTGKYLIDRAPQRTFDAPMLGELVSSFAYPELRGTDPNSIMAEAFAVTHFRVGHVTALFPEGRDRLILPRPCFQSSIDVRGGMSGGPVFNSSGQLCGVNATSFDAEPGAQPVSFVSLLAPCNEMSLPDDRQERMVPIRELLALGF